MVNGQKQARDWNQRFAGYRVNCENVPALPAWAVRWFLEDPRKVAYLFIWQSPRTEKVREAVQAVRQTPLPYLPAGTECVQLRRPDGNATNLHIFKRPLPRNGGLDFLLACSLCCSLRRALYGWANSFGRVSWTHWQCRTCAGLRYASEGGALVYRQRGGFGRLLEQALGPLHNDRPEPWYPYVFSNPADAVDAGLAEAKGSESF